MNRYWYPLRLALAIVGGLAICLHGFTTHQSGLACVLPLMAFLAIVALVGRPFFMVYMSDAGSPPNWRDTEKAGFIACLVLTVSIHNASWSSMTDKVITTPWLFITVVTSVMVGSVGYMLTKFLSDPKPTPGRRPLSN